MSKSITIKEGNTSKTFADVAKLRTNLVGSGSCTWVPEDETQLVDKRITANGEYSPASDDAYGYGVVTVDIDLPTKHITKNGTYQASADNKEGWSEVEVNVAATNGKDTDGNDYSITDDGSGGATFSMADGDYNMTVDETTDPETGEVTPIVSLTNIAKIRFTAVGSYEDMDELDLSDFTVTAYIGDAEGQDVSSQCSYSMADGTVLHYGTDYTLTASWTYQGRTYRTATSFTVERGDKGSGQISMWWHFDWDGSTGTHTVSGYCTSPVKAILFKWPHTEPQYSGKWHVWPVLANASDNPVSVNVSPFTISAVNAHSYASGGQSGWADQIVVDNVFVFETEDMAMAEQILNAYVQGGNFSGGGHEF